MSKEPLPQSIADLPAQRASAPKSKAESRALYFNTGNAFNLQLPRVPDESFTDEPKKALDPAAPTGLIACDRAEQLGCSFPATTPLVLARYARIRGGETLETNFAASGVIGYVIAGSGSTECGSERIEWKPGDTFVLPGGIPHTYRASGSDAVLWIVTNEPQLAFENLRPPKPGEAPTDPVHFPASEVQKQIELLYQVGRGEDIAGSALIFSSERQEANRNVLPTLTVAMNSLPPGKSQRPHRHNSVAVSLVIQGEGCYSVVDGRRKDWSQWATTVTPATSVHAHHNGGGKNAMFLIVQDGGIYYHTRALGFEFVETKE
jgi:gentisate 1,2-dioxygenase